VKPRSPRMHPVSQRRSPRASEAERLARLKSAIQQGEYETPEKLDQTLRNLLADLRESRRSIGVSRADETGGERP